MLILTGFNLVTIFYFFSSQLKILLKVNIIFFTFHPKVNRLDENETNYLKYNKKSRKIIIY